MHSLTLDRKICVMHTPNKSKEPTEKQQKWTETNEAKKKKEKKIVGVCLDQTMLHPPNSVFGSAPNYRAGKHNEFAGKMSKMPGTIYSFAHLIQKWLPVEEGAFAVPRLWPIVRLGPSFLAVIKFTTHIIYSFFIRFAAQHRAESIDSVRGQLHLWCDRLKKVKRRI